MLSLVFGCLSALLWSTELALTYPLTIMFGEHHTVPNYVRHEIEQSSKLVVDLSIELREKKLERVSLPDDQTRARSKERLKVIIHTPFV